MTQTAAQYLAEVTSTYTPSSSQFDGAKSRKASIQSRLDLSFGLHELFETGSLRHGTGVWLYSDADYMASLKGIKPSSEWTTLNKVKKTFRLGSRHDYRGATARRRVQFSDGAVEVTPAYPNTKPNGVQDGYWIPDPRGGWMKTHPKDHNAYVNKANQKHNGAAKKLARQAKIWKYKRGIPVSSCYLEMRAAKYADGESSWLPVYDLYLFLNGLLGHNLASMNDPTDLGSRFNATSSDSNHADAISKLSTAVTRARKAKDFESDGKHASAIEQLKLLFDQ